jgi:hypothetical protein
MRATWRYAIGVMKNRVADMEDRARDLMESGDI